jgi:hypothetical protein
MVFPWTKEAVSCSMRLLNELATIVRSEPRTPQPATLTLPVVTATLLTV